MGKHRDRDDREPSKGGNDKDGGRHDVGRDGDTGKRTDDKGNRQDKRK